MGIGIAIGAFLIFLSYYITYQIAAPPQSFGPGDDRWAYYTYSRLFENIKCMNTNHKYNEYDILEALYYLGIPKERARELFQENKEKLEQKIATGENTGLSLCQQETLQYYDMALNVLDHLSDTGMRERNKTDRQIQYDIEKKAYEMQRQEQLQ